MLCLCLGNAISCDECWKINERQLFWWVFRVVSVIYLLRLCIGLVLSGPFGVAHTASLRLRSEAKFLEHSDVEESMGLVPF